MLETALRLEVGEKRFGHLKSVLDSLPGAAMTALGRCARLEALLGEIAADTDHAWGDRIAKEFSK